MKHLNANLDNITNVETGKIPVGIPRPIGVDGSNDIVELAVNGTVTLPSVCRFYDIVDTDTTATTVEISILIDANNAALYPNPFVLGNTLELYARDQFVFEDVGGTNVGPIGTLVDNPTVSNTFTINAIRNDTILSTPVIVLVSNQTFANPQTLEVLWVKNVIQSVIAQGETVSGDLCVTGNILLDGILVDKAGDAIVQSGAIGDQNSAAALQINQGGTVTTVTTCTGGTAFTANQGVAANSGDYAFFDAAGIELADNAMFTAGTQDTTASNIAWIGIKGAADAGANSNWTPLQLAILAAAGFPTTDPTFLNSNDSQFSTSATDSRLAAASPAALTFTPFNLMVTQPDGGTFTVSVGWVRTDPGGVDDPILIGGTSASLAPAAGFGGDGSNPFGLGINALYPFYFQPNDFQIGPTGAYEDGATATAFNVSVTCTAGGTTTTTPTVTIDGNLAVGNTITVTPSSKSGILCTNNDAQIFDGIPEALHSGGYHLSNVELSVIGNGVDLSLPAGQAGNQSTHGVSYVTFTGNPTSFSPVAQAIIDLSGVTVPSPTANLGDAFTVANGDFTAFNIGHAQDEDDATFAFTVREMVIVNVGSRNNLYLGGTARDGRFGTPTGTFRGIGNIAASDFIITPTGSYRSQYSASGSLITNPPTPRSGTWVLNCEGPTINPTSTSGGTKSDGGSNNTTSISSTSGATTTTTNVTSQGVSTTTGTTTTAVTPTGVTTTTTDNTATASQVDAGDNINTQTSVTSSGVSITDGDNTTAITPDTLTLGGAMATAGVQPLGVNTTGVTTPIPQLTVTTPVANEPLVTINAPVVVTPPVVAPVVTSPAVTTTCVPSTKVIMDSDTAGNNIADPTVLAFVAVVGNVAAGPGDTTFTLQGQISDDDVTILTGATFFSLQASTPSTITSVDKTGTNTVVTFTPAIPAFDFVSSNRSLFVSQACVMMTSTVTDPADNTSTTNNSLMLGDNLAISAPVMIDGDTTAGGNMTVTGTVMGGGVEPVISTFPIPNSVQNTAPANTLPQFIRLASYITLPVGETPLRPEGGSYDVDTRSFTTPTSSVEGPDLNGTPAYTNTDQVWYRNRYEAASNFNAGVSTITVPGFTTQGTLNLSSAGNSGLNLRFVGNQVLASLTLVSSPQAYFTQTGTQAPFIMGASQTQIIFDNLAGAPGFFGKISQRGADTRRQSAIGSSFNGLNATMITGLPGVTFDGTFYNIPGSEVTVNYGNRIGGSTTISNPNANNNQTWCSETVDGIDTSQQGIVTTFDDTSDWSAPQIASGTQSAAQTTTTYETVTMAEYAAIVAYNDSNFDGQQGPYTTGTGDALYRPNYNNTIFYGS